MTITRFAPSPTGYLHVGNLRTALMNFLIARKVGGCFILRIDDTDPNRSQESYVKAIQEDLDWLGLHWNRLERQSDRLDKYYNSVSDLRNNDRLYEAFETSTELELKRKKQLNAGQPPVYDRSALKLTEKEQHSFRQERGNGVWRFKLDHQRITWCDQILGDLSIDCSSVSDPVLIRQDGQFLYTLASVVDDLDMGITHVVRGSDHVTNTAIQVQIIKALGGDVPQFAHHSLLTDTRGDALAKRLGTLALRDLRKKGIEPMALLSLLARLGTSKPVELRTSMDELIDGFCLSEFGTSSTKFDESDLYPLTGRYLQTLPFSAVSSDLSALGIPSSVAEQVWYAVRNNIETLNDVRFWWAIFQDGAEPLIDDRDRTFICQAIKLLPSGPVDNNTWKLWTDLVKSETGRKGRELFMPLRKALTGQSHGPDMSIVMPLLHVIKVRDLVE
ncbi:MAG: glutamate--tRNA ligase [Aestuariivita sp.]|nr:glutamate--tRNA ligase [Aestuariivita sp.]